MQGLGNLDRITERIQRLKFEKGNRLLVKEMNDTINALFVTPVTSQVVPSTVVLSILMAFVLGQLIVLSYNSTIKNQLPQHNIQNFITMITMVTTMVIIPISVNAVLSLGMVGALSVIRFRTAIKSPTDTAYIYWGIAVGICLGAGFYLPAFVGTLLIGLLLEFNKVLTRTSKQKYILNLEYSTQHSHDVQDKIREYPTNTTLLTIVRRDEIEFVTLETSEQSLIEDMTSLTQLNQVEVVVLQEGLVS